MYNGVWKKATMLGWQDGQYITLKKQDERLVLLIHESKNSMIPWTLGMNDSLNMKFIKLQ